MVEAILFVGQLLSAPAFILGLRPSRHDRAELIPSLSRECWTARRALH